MKYDFETLVDRSNSGSGKWDEMKAKKPDLDQGIVPFSVADMEFKNPPEVIQGLKNYLDSNILGYTSPTKEYLDTVCDWMQKQHNWEIKPEQICCTHGVVPALFMLVATFCKPGDGVIVMPPVYYPFYMAVETNGCATKRCPLIYKDGSYFIDFDLLDKVASESDSKLLIFCSPHNPVGRVWTKEELAKVGEICKRHGVIIISDEIHFDIIMPGYTHTVFSTIEGCEDVIVCTAPSKTFNLATMQTSNIIIPDAEQRKQFGDICAKYCAHGPGALGFEACRIAYTQCKGWMAEMLQVISGNYQFAVDFIAKHLPEIKPIELQGTYLLWLDCTALGKTAKELEDIMINKAQLFFDEGYVFGSEGEGFERINLAVPQWVLEAGLQRMEKALRA